MRLAVFGPRRGVPEPPQLWDEGARDIGLEGVAVDRTRETKGASMPRKLSAAITVVVFQRPCETPIRSEVSLARAFGSRAGLPVASASNV
jgi:hypothetical protein